MDAPSTLTPESFSILAVFLRADWVVKAVLTGLILASLWSWTVIIDKLFRLAALNREADRFEDQVASGRSLEQIAADAGEAPRQALPRMLQAALREWREAQGQGMTTRAETQIALPAAADRPGDGFDHRPREPRVEEGLGTLAIVATASPFVGLFGTVWGIMHAFQSIALAEEHQPVGGRPLDRRGSVRHRRRPGRRHPRLYRLQQVLDRRGQVHRPAGGLRRRTVGGGPRRLAERV